MGSRSEPDVQVKGNRQSKKNEKRLSKKRKHDQVSNLPDIDVNPDGKANPMTGASDDVNISSKKRKRIKAGRAKEAEGVHEGTDGGHITDNELKVPADAGVPNEKRIKKRKISKGSRKDTDTGSAVLEGASIQGGHPVSNESVAGTKTEQDRQGSRPKFIVFIGNLPFTATTESVAKHFAKLKPISVRHRTHKETGKSKGFAFLEFDGYDRMKTCLKLYHHSDFDDGISPTRKVNVDLTAGGGGSKSEERRSKLKAKNEKLNEQRKRRILEEEKLKRERADKPTGDRDDIHPSRRGRVQNS